MRYFAGLDVSLEETAICVIDENGVIVKEVRATSEPEALIVALREVGLPLERVGLEACSLTAWLYEGLRQAGFSAICIETRQANAAMKTMPNKTDRNDARALAQIMRTGWYREVHVKTALAFASGCSPHGGQRDAIDRERGAGNPAGGRHQARHAGGNCFCRSCPRTRKRRRLGDAARRASAVDPRHDAARMRPFD